MQSETKAKALEQFTDYFVKNYPGPDTVIYDPKWHAPKLFAAAHHAITAALSDQERAVEVKACQVCGGDIARYDFDPQGCACGRPAENLRRFTMVFDGEDGWTMLPDPDGEYVKFEDATRSALVDVPVEPVGYASEYGLKTLADKAHHYCLSLSKKPENEFTQPIYIRPPHREGEDSAEVIEEGAKILAKWIGYAWDGLSDRDISAEYKDWAYNGIGALGMQGGKPALRKVAASILALAASRSGSATTAKDADHG